VTRRRATTEARQTWRLADRTARTAAGIVIDGTVHRLEGEPPIATSNGWGIVPGR